MSTNSRRLEPYNELFRAVAESDVNGVRDSVNSGINVNSRDTRHIVGHGNSPLHDAANTGSLPVVRLLLQLGADIDARCNSGWTPLLRACNAGHDAVAKALVEAGADVNLANDEGYRPIHRVAASNTDFIAWLKEHGAEP